MKNLFIKTLYYENLKKHKNSVVVKLLKLTQKENKNVTYNDNKDIIFNRDAYGLRGLALHPYMEAVPHPRF